MKLVLKTIRKTFPYQSVKHHPKEFAYIITWDYAHAHRYSIRRKGRGSIKKYKKNYNFLKGGHKKVLRDLKKERDALSKSEEYEKANEYQEKINSILIVTSPSYSSFDFQVNPNLKTDIRNAELLALKKELKNTESQVSSLGRIECFDISNISGKFAVGVMVVFLDGEKETSLYRRFKIKFTKEKTK